MAKIKDIDIPATTRKHLLRYMEQELQETYRADMSAYSTVSMGTITRQRIKQTLIDLKVTDDELKDHAFLADIDAPSDIVNEKYARWVEIAAGQVKKEYKRGKYDGREIKTFFSSVFEEIDQKLALFFESKC